MRVVAIVVGLMLSMAATAAAQEWEEFVSKDDGFKVDFPGKPKVTDMTWKSQMDYILPGKVYSVDKGKEHYSMTVVDYRPIEQQGIERAKTCEEGNQQWRQNAGIMVPGYWRHDERSALMYATFKLLQRDAKLTSLAWEWEDMVEGNFVQLTNNADQSRTFAYVAMRENKLYILEGTVPKGYPEPGLFQQSIGWVDANGNGIRYQNVIYSNAYHGMGVYPSPLAGGGFAPPAHGQGHGRGRGQGQRADRSVIGPAYATHDIRGALVYASFQFIKRDATIEHYLWNWEDLVEGHEIHMTNRADQSRTMAFIAMRENRLYILEGT